MANPGQLQELEKQRQQIIQGLANVVQTLRSTAHATEQFVSLLSQTPIATFTAANPQATSVPVTTPVEVAADGNKRKRAEGGKKEKDPNEPKRPPSAYLLFQNQVRREVMQKNPQMPYKQILTEISAAWKGLSDQEKQIYFDAVKLAKDEWLKERDVYVAMRNAGTIPGGPVPVPKKPLATKETDATSTTTATDAHPEPAEETSSEEESESDSDETPPTKRTKPAAKEATDDSSTEESDTESDEQARADAVAKKLAAGQSKKPPSKHAAATHTSPNASKKDAKPKKPKVDKGKKKMVD